MRRRNHRLRNRSTVAKQGQEVALLTLMDTPRPDVSLEIRRRLKRTFRPILESDYFTGVRFLLQQIRQYNFKDEIS